MNVFDKEITTDRLILRRLHPKDAYDMFEYTSIEEVTRHLSWHPHTDINQAVSYIKTITHEYENSINCFTWGIVIKSEEKLIGSIRAFDASFHNKRIELSYILNPVFQGRGYITEALLSVIDFCKKSGFNRIQAKCTLKNLASEKVMLKLGMQYEGTMKGYWINKGIIRDAKSFALIISSEITDNNT